MEQSIGDQIREKGLRENRIERRKAIVDWLAERWQHFRLLQEAALWRQIDQPIPIDDDLAQRYYRSEGELLSYLREAEKLDLVEIVFTEETCMYQINRNEESLAGQFLKELFR